MNKEDLINNKEVQNLIDAGILADDGDTILDR